MLLDILPLDLFICKEAVKANIRAHVSGKSEVNEAEDIEIWNISQETEILRTSLNTTDYLDKEYLFERTFETFIEDRSDFRFEDNVTQSCFTDGSKTENGTGAGVYLENRDEKRSFKLDDHATVFQGEVFAIKKVASILAERQIKNEIVSIYSDSQAAIKSIENFQINSKLVKDTITLLNSVGKLNNLKLVWIPAHSGYHGNEVADKLAKNGANSCKRKGSVIVGAPIGKFMTDVEHIFTKLATTQWFHTPGLTHSKSFIKGFNKHRCHSLLKLSREIGRAHV